MTIALLREIFMHRLFLCLSLIASFFLLDTGIDAQEQQSKEDLISFDREIKPILAKHCFACHGPENQEGSIGFHEEKEALKLGDSEEYAIVPGKPDKSQVVHRIQSSEESERMPPEGKGLSENEIHLIKKWIEQGAKWEKHWAFEKPVRPVVPEVQNSEWVRNPIDAFILKRLENNNLPPAPPASRETLIRRVYYDLTGLPPSYEEVQAFLADQSEDAYEKVIDQLLASPHYGEKWGRHWLDLVRFSETNGFERDGTKPNAWKYRDYVIRSFNEDKPYDQFITEQLAGDEMETVTRETITGTGYYRLGVWDDEPADKLLSRYNEYDDIVSTTGQVFLGLTINCARCHEHKIDPILQEDYYKLVAFFRDIPTFGIRGVQFVNNQTDVSPPEVITQYNSLTSHESQIKKEYRKIEDAAILKMPAELRSRIDNGGREKVLKEHLREFVDEPDWNSYEKLKSEANEIQAQIKKLPPKERVLSISNCTPRPEKTYVLLRGNPQSHGEEVQPGFPALFSVEDPDLKEPPKDAKSAQRRIVLANWIASKENMLTGRVIVNRIWQHHFGRGIVRSASNFGQLGTPPTHPKLLDWLAMEFVDNGWKFKQFHKLILLSNTYRMSSEENQQALEQDPTNNDFWRFDMRRLSAEELRDSILCANGQLNRKVYGKSFYPKLSDEVLQTQSRPGQGWGKSTPQEMNRRSVYIFAKRSLVPPIMSVFDAPDQDSTCEARFTTTQPGQALNLLNSRFIHEQARIFQQKVFQQNLKDRKLNIRFTYQSALGRDATEEEIQRGEKMIQELITENQLSEEEAFQYFCLMILNLNEFIYLD